MSACDRCLRRSWALVQLSGHLEPVRSRIDELLGLGEQDLVAAVGGREQGSLARALEQFDPVQARHRATRSGLEQICRCDSRYPGRLAALPNPPAVLHVAGGIERFLEQAAGDPVAIVGARRASTYGADVARSLGRGLAASGLTVVSGMALGIDSAAHTGALSVPGPTIAVLPGSADRPYPADRAALHRTLIESAAVVSELPPGAGIRRWMFPARNRLIAGLAALTVVVEARARSGALVTARVAEGLGRPVGAVPGRVTSSQSAGPNGLLAAGAYVIRDAQDVLDVLFGAGVRTAADDRRARLDPELRRLLDAVASGSATVEELADAGFDPVRALAGLAELELTGYVRRELGGRFGALP